MVKKLKKYVKVVVCCALMLSLMAPSYAALSASDGSAFVTKAEFDSALADFNARLTTFEAGINSKIDSQVTSYLDRNGIWSGKEQELTLLAHGGSICDDNGTIPYMLFKSQNSVNWYKANNLKGNWVTEQWKLIDKCNKSGLLYLTWQINGFPGSSTVVFNPYQNSKMRSHSDESSAYERYIWTGYGLTTKKDSTNPKDYYGLTEIMSSSLVATTGTWLAGTDVQFSQPTWSGDNLFFVEVDDPVFWAIMTNAYSSNGIRWYFTHSGNVTHVGDAFMHVLNAKIY